MSRLLSIAAGVHPMLSPVDMVTAAAEAGWPACGVWFDAATWTDATTAEVHRRLDATGITALDLEPIIPALDSPDHGERLLEAAAGIGAQYVLFTSRLPDLGATAARFAELCSVAAPLGVRLVCEFLPIFPLRSLSMAAEVVAPHAPTVAGILIDNLHLSRSGASVADVAALDPARLPYLQIADAPAAVPTEPMALLDEAINGRLLPGEGALPIAELLAAVPEVPLSFEVRSRALRDGFSDPVERAQHLLAASRSLLG